MYCAELGQRDWLLLHGAASSARMVIQLTQQRCLYERALDGMSKFRSKKDVSAAWSSGTQPTERGERHGRRYKGICGTRSASFGRAAEIFPFQGRRANDT